MLLIPDHDPFDPNFLDFGLDHEYYIMGDDHGDVRARVDAEDYWFFCRWRWFVDYDRTGRKKYLRRTGSDRSSGVKVHPTIYLHVAIQKRKGIPQPLHHTMVDHGDGDSLNCRRYNLDWATPSMNRRNIYGQRGIKL